MTIKQHGGVFGRNPKFNSVEAETLNVTGDMNVDTNTLFVDSSTNRVGINNTSPTQELEVDGTIRVNLDVNDYAVGVVSSGGGGLFIEPDDYEASNPTWKFRTFANENIAMFRGNSDCGTFNANGLAFPDGKGIDFSATSGTGTSELFDDYEEGTWVPTLTTDGTDFDSVTYDGITYGWYTKVGNVVSVGGRLRTDAITVGSGSGNVVIGGLPFSVVKQSGIAIGYAASFVTKSPLFAEAPQGQAYIKLYGLTSLNANSTTLTTANVSTSSNSNYITFSGVYQV